MAIHMIVTLSLCTRTLGSLATWPERSLPCVVCFFEKVVLYLADTSRYLYDLSQGGMEMPCLLKFRGNSKK